MHITVLESILDDYVRQVLEKRALRIDQASNMDAVLEELEDRTNISLETLLKYSKARISEAPVIDCPVCLDFCALFDPNDFEILYDCPFCLDYLEDFEDDD